MVEFFSGGVLARVGAVDAVDAVFTIEVLPPRFRWRAGRRRCRWSYKIAGAPVIATRPFGADAPHQVGFGYLLNDNS